MRDEAKARWGAQLTRSRVWKILDHHGHMDMVEFDSELSANSAGTYSTDALFDWLGY